MLVSACYHALSLRYSKRKFKRITTQVSPYVTSLQCQYDRNCLRGRWRKSPRVNGIVGRDWQRVQKTMLVSACYHALSLRDSKRKFKWITTRVSPLVTWLQCQYDWNWLRGRWRKSPRVNGLVDRDWQRVQKTMLVSACYHALSLRDSKSADNHLGISACHVTPVSVWQKLWGGRQKRGSCSYVSSMRKSDLRSSG